MEVKEIVFESIKKTLNGLVPEHYSRMEFLDDPKRMGDRASMLRLEINFCDDEGFTSRSFTAQQLLGIGAEIETRLGEADIIAPSPYLTGVKVFWIDRHARRAAQKAGYEVQPEV